MNKTYLYIKDSFELKDHLLIKRREKVRNEILKKSKNIH